MPFYVKIQGADSPDATITVPTPRPPMMGLVFSSRVFHMILEVTDDGSPSLTSYRRAIITISDKDANGAACKK